MSYGICRVQKVKAAGVKAMQYHNDRMPGEHSNADIDHSRTHLNYELCRHGSYSREVQERIERYRESDRKVRKDAVVMVEGIVTASPEWFESHTEEEARAFFADACEFVKGWMGEENVIHFTVHVDETTWHAHWGGTPIKDGALSWKKFFDGRDALRAFQDAFYEQVSSRYGMGRGECDTGRKHKDLQEMKRDTLREVAGLREEAEVQRGAVELANEDLERTTSEVIQAEQRLECLQRSIEQKELEPPAESLAESARTLYTARGDGSRERELEGEESGLRSGIGELERQVQEARSRAGELERDVERLGVGVRDAGERCERARERVAHLLDQLGWIPERLSEFAQGIGRKLGLRVMDGFTAFAQRARDSADAWNAAHATRGVSQDREWKQAR